ncbi:MAG: hypothetical protein EOO37_00050 [Cytophagaceae bacterium]|nr:MAG: hypothetical protein EOO37_00050 [Cytophagaceae bacterium]
MDTPVVDTEACNAQFSQLAIQGAIGQEVIVNLLFNGLTSWSNVSRVGVKSPALHMLVDEEFLSQAFENLPLVSLSSVGAGNAPRDIEPAPQKLSGSK